MRILGHAPLPRLPLGAGPGPARHRTTVRAATPLADIHTHYKWSQAEVTSPQEAIAALVRENVELAVVIGTPADFALRLEALDPDRIVPIYSPYRQGRNWFQWARDPKVVEEARAALASGDYHGIGELHAIGGFAPRRQHAQVLEGLLALGAEFKAPLLIHTEFSSPGPMLDICVRHPDAPILWAHAGALLDTDEVREVTGGEGDKKAHEHPRQLEQLLVCVCVE